MNTPVSSASRKSQTLSEVSSAVFVITQEDIQRSGATTIPDLLRMVPGVKVARLNGNTWAVSIRGFNGTFANKLLVMIDGRSVYTPLYGGVFWDVQDTLFSEIERIEVIRGPGSTMWGANAVNGVINIITKGAQDTKGGKVTALTGTWERDVIGARYGASLGENSAYRLYFKRTDRRDTISSTAGAHDFLTLSQGGFRLDSSPTAELNLTLQGDAYGGGDGNTVNVATTSFPFNQLVSQDRSVFGANLLARADWLQSPFSKLSLQLYYDRTDRDTSIVREARDTVDLDLQHTFRFGGSHELTWGAGYRFIHDDVPGTRSFQLVPQSRSLNLLNLFAQDEITLVPDLLRLVLGTKLEHGDLSGWDLEPSAQLSFTPSRALSLWASVSRAVRTPTRGEQDVRIPLLALPPAPPAALPGVLVFTGNRRLSSESLVAYQLGARSELDETLSADVSTFYNRYYHIITPTPGAPFPEGGNQLTVPLLLANQHGYDSTGGEASLKWQPREWWKLKGGYSYIRFFGPGVQDSLAIKGTPRHQATLRSMLALGTRVDLDLWVRYVGSNRYPLVFETVEIPAYTTLDCRLAWRPRPGLELSLVGQNLLQPRHLEAASDQTPVRNEVERSVYGKLAWAF